MDYKDFFNDGRNDEGQPAEPVQAVNNEPVQAMNPEPVQPVNPEPVQAVNSEPVQPAIAEPVQASAPVTADTGSRNPYYGNDAEPPRPEPRPLGPDGQPYGAQPAYTAPSPQQGAYAYTDRQPQPIPQPAQQGAYAYTDSQPQPGPQPQPRPAPRAYDRGRQYAPFTPQPARQGAGAAAAVKAPLVDRKRFIVLVIIIIVAMAASGVAGGFIGANMTKSGTPSVASGSAKSAEITITPDSDANITEAVAQKVLDSVVGITSTVTTNMGSYYGFDLGEQETGGVGTGMIVDKNGYILTNSHVVLDGEAEKIEVLLSDGSTVTGSSLWNDSSIDLAIVKIDAAGKTLNPVELGDSDKVRIGSYVAAIGNPLGLDFNGSITQGVVSGLGRSITATDGTTQTTMEGLIQVDAAINSGNSGGPLLNSEGKVIGVNTAKAEAEGMGFAIPINTAKPIIEKVIKTGSFERVYMGVSAGDAASIAEMYPSLKLDSNVKGAFITAVSGDSPADNAGLKMKDIITAVDDTKIETSAELIKTLLNYSAGDTVTVTYLRDGKEATAKVKLATQADVYGEWNQDSESSTQGGSGSGGSQTPDNPYGGQTPSDPYGGSDDGTDPFANPFGDW